MSYIINKLPRLQDSQYADIYRYNCKMFLSLHLSIYIIIIKLVTGGEMYCRKAQMARDTLKENLERAIHDNPVTLAFRRSYF
jgi:hypothetical protein